MNTIQLTANRNVWRGKIALGALCGHAIIGCGAAPSARPICREAGFGDAEVQALLPNIQAAHDAGAARAEVIADAATACAACADANPPCLQTACEECFALLIDEVYGESDNDTDESPPGK